MYTSVDHNAHLRLSQADYHCDSLNNLNKLEAMAPKKDKSEKTSVEAGKAPKR